MQYENLENRLLHGNKTIGYQYTAYLTDLLWFFRYYMGFGKRIANITRVIYTTHTTHFPMMISDERLMRRNSSIFHNSSTKHLE